MSYVRGHTTDRAQSSVRRGVAGFKGVDVVPGDPERVYPPRVLVVPAVDDEPVTAGGEELDLGDPASQTVYVQPTDPGAVGAGKLWVDTSEGTPPRILIRDADGEWVDLLEGYIAAGPVSILATDGNALFGRSDDGVVTAQLELASGQSTLVAQDEDGIETGGLRISNLIGVEDLTFSFSGDGLPEVPASPTEQDIVDALLALGLVTQAAP